MTELELKRIIAERFAQANLLPYLSEGQQQCLEMEKSFFVEIVLKDASKILEAEKIVEQIQAEQTAHGVLIEPIVRALWEVKSVRHVGTPPAESGGIKAAERFYAVLESGNTEQSVEVDLSWGALEELKARTGRVDTASLERLVANFLKLHLSAGGLSYWDPMRSRHQDVGPAAVTYLLEHSPMTAA